MQTNRNSVHSKLVVIALLPFRKSAIFLGEKRNTEDSRKIFEYRGFQYSSLCIEIGSPTQAQLRGSAS